MPTVKPPLTIEEIEYLDERLEAKFILQYIAEGEPDGCYWCGGTHATSRCKDAPGGHDE